MVAALDSPAPSRLREMAMTDKEKDLYILSRMRG